jgi:hypothetical protein
VRLLGDRKRDCPATEEPRKDLFSAETTIGEGDKMTTAQKVFNRINTAKMPFAGMADKQFEEPSIAEALYEFECAVEARAFDRMRPELQSDSKWKKQCARIDKARKVVLKLAKETK